MLRIKLSSLPELQKAWKDPSLGDACSEWIPGAVQGNNNRH